MSHPHLWRWTLALVLAAQTGHWSAMSGPADPSVDMDSANATLSAAETSVLADTDIAHADAARVQGSPTAKVWVVMASDFQCPYCKEWHDETYAQIVSAYVKTGKIRLAYVNYPVVSLHPHAMEAAEAAMCAAAQNHFWDIHDALFATQATWAPRPSPTTFFDSLAKKVGVNMTRWRTCVSTHQMKPLVDADMDRSTKGGVHGTPSFFIGNELLVGVQTFAVLRTRIEAALAKGGGDQAPTAAPPAR